MGISAEGGKTRDPRQKRSEGVDGDTQLGASMLFIYFFPVLISNSLAFSE